MFAIINEEGGKSLLNGKGLREHGGVIEIREEPWLLSFLPLARSAPPVLLHTTDSGITYDPATIITALGNLGHQPDHPYFTNLRTESNIDTFAPTEGRFTGCYGLILSATPNWADGRPRLEPQPFEAHGCKMWVTLAIITGPSKTMIFTHQEWRSLDDDDPEFYLFILLCNLNQVNPQNVQSTNGLDHLWSPIVRKACFWAPSCFCGCQRTNPRLGIAGRVVEGGAGRNTRGAKGKLGLVWVVARFSGSLDWVC
ncbi:hypothetical protein C348_03800 [Cryptococcus neoformans Gb118]|nr:hypothetical protein C350_03554 [Cryptococcus neoformans var. grubii MW-RSA36]OXL07933.1 hypothetical protein C348_03800 [Cryptococcus neoformans var. grubii Gb118]